jgi:uncharacterized protein YpuA (DUF1002 family)
MGDALAGVIAAPASAAAAKVSEENDAVNDSEILEALELLDHADDEQWTTAGKPKVEAVEAILGYDIGRKDIDRVAHDFVRIAQ